MIRLDDVTLIYPFEKVSGLFDRKKKKEILEKQKAMPYTSNEGVVALQHFSDRFDKGDFVAVLGPSGSGKTTLLRILAGLERPSLGEVYYDDVPLHEIDLEERDIGMVFQNYSLYPKQTVYKNIAFPLEVQHLPRDEVKEKVEEAADLLGLSNKLQKQPDELSGGEKQRVAIARAIIKKPQVLLLDEPFANLDVPIRRRLRRMLKDIHERYGMTIIYVTHDQYDALALSKKIIILKDGIKVCSGDLSDVYRKPPNLFSARFLGFPQMNVFEDVKVNKDGSYTILTKDFHLDQKHKRALKNGRMSVGLRPGDLKISDRGVKAVVEYVEMAEADLIIHLAVNEEKIIALEKMNSELIPYLRGQEVFLSFEEEDLHLFDEEGNRI